MRFVGLAALVLLAGCAPSTPPPPVIPPPPSIEVAPPASASPAPVPEILKFTATTWDGKAFDAKNLVGKPAVFWFWAAWCPQCKGDATTIRELQKTAGSTINFVGVGGLGSGSDGMRLFVGEHKLTGFPQIADDQGAVWKRFEVPSQHYYVILDAAGKVVHRGPLTVDELRKKIGA